MTDAIASLGESPEIAAIGCVALVPVVIWVWSVVHWLVMSEMDVLLGVVGIMVALLLGMVAMMPPEPVHSPIALGGIVGMMIVFPIAKRQLDRRAIIEIEVEQIEKAYKVLSERPESASALFRLADCLYGRGLVGPAVELGERALAGMPKNVFPDENRAVHRWRHAASDASLFRPLPCLECGHSNPCDVAFCGSCGASYLAAYARGKWLGSALVRRLVASWAAAVVSLLGLPLTVSAIEDVYLVVLLCSVQVGVVILLLWRAFLSKEAN